MDHLVNVTCGIIRLQPVSS